MPTDRDLDIAVFGATGFVGRLTAEHLAANAPDGVKIGLAGRSLDRLEAVRAGLGTRAADWPLLKADVTDADSLAELARSARVVATTVGPYRRYGMPLLEACATAGTHYADLTGEVLFMREAIDRFDGVAKQSGARIVHNCGFDSIPSDLGVLLLHKAAQADGAGELEDTTGVMVALRGGLSGGTFASMKDQLDEVKGDSKLRRTMFDPYALSPDREREPKLGTEGDVMRPKRDEQLGAWVAPFVMAAVNTRVVRRSNALQDWAYGRRFDYHEVMGVGSGPLAPVKAAGVAAALGGLFAGLSLPPTRKLLDRVLPDPGEGPSESSRRNGYFKFDLHARAADGRRYRARVAAKGDPGYAATSVMLGESALCLALDEDDLPPATGVLTPATAMGTALADRLRTAGQTLEARPA